MGGDEEGEIAYKTRLMITDNSLTIESDVSNEERDELDWDTIPWGEFKQNLDATGEFSDDDNTTGVTSKDVIVIDNFAYVSHGYGGLEIIDVSLKSNPTKIGQFKLRVDEEHHDFLNAASISGDLAFLAFSRHGMMIVNISDPSTPFAVGNFTLGDGGEQDFTNLMIKDGIGYLAYGSNGLVIVNVSDPHNPYELSSLRISTGVKGVFVENNIVYIADSSKLLIVLNVTDPLSPILLAKKDISIGAQDIFVFENHIFMVGHNGYGIYDGTDPSTPEVLREFRTEGIQDLYVDAEYLYLPTRWGLEVFKISDIENPVIVARFIHEVSGQGVFTDGNYIYLASGSKGLIIFDRNFSELEDLPIRFGSSPDYLNTIMGFSLISTIFFGVLGVIIISIKSIKPVKTKSNKIIN